MPKNLIVRRITSANPTTWVCPAGVTQVTVRGITSTNNVIASSSSGAHFYAIIDGQSALSWGLNGSGQLGNNTITSTSLFGYMANSMSINGDNRLSSFFNGAPTLIMKSGQGFRWGAPPVGDGTTASRSFPTAISASPGVTWRFLSGADTYGVTNFVGAGITTAGMLYTWGRNDFGQLGNNTTTTTSVPSVITAPSGSNQWVAIAGGNTPLALDTNGDLWSWGKNDSGQVGDGTTANRSSPVRINGTTKFKKLVQHTMANTAAAIDVSDTLWMWGDGTSGQLGQNSLSARSTPTQLMSPFTNAKWKDVWASGSSGSVMGVLADTQPSGSSLVGGTTYVWGDATSGQLGQGNVANVSSPIAVSTIQPIAAGGSVSTLYFLGFNNNVFGLYAAGNQVGDNTTTSRSTFTAVYQVSSNSGGITPNWYDWIYASMPKTNSPMAVRTVSVAANVSYTINLFATYVQFGATQIGFGSEVREVQIEYYA